MATPCSVIANTLRACFRVEQITIRDMSRTSGRVIGDAGNDHDDERGEHGAVLAAAEADQPGAGVLQVQAAKGVFDFTVLAGTHWREHRSQLERFKHGFCPFGADLRTGRKEEDQIEDNGLRGHETTDCTTSG